MNHVVQQSFSIFKTTVTLLQLNILMCDYKNGSFHWKHKRLCDLDIVDIAVHTAK